MFEIIAATVVLAFLALAWVTLSRTATGREASLRAARSLPPPLGVRERWIDLPSLPPVIDPAEDELAQLEAEIEECNRAEKRTDRCPPPDGFEDITVDVSDFAELDELAAYDACPPEQTGTRSRSPRPQCVDPELDQAVGDDCQLEIPRPAMVPRFYGGEGL